MNRRLAVLAAVVASLLGGVAWVSADAPVAYDEYNNGTKVRDWNRLPGTDCLTAGGQRRMVPDRQPLSVCTATTTTTSTTTTTRPPTTTVAPTTTTRPPTTTTTVAPTTTTPPPTGRFNTLPVGAALPSGASCASQVRSMSENRPQNATYNATIGTSPHDEFPRVDGAFTGTTDEILQWAACKWGIDEDWLRAQIVTESWWDQRTVGDTGDQCTSHGVGQVRRCYHDPAFEDENAVNSTAYNADYTYQFWRACYNGDYTWLNTVERGRDYAAGDLLGCMGVWFSGRWYTAPAINYMNTVTGHFNSRTWETANFGPAVPDGGGTPPTTTAAPTTTVAPTTTTTVAPPPGAQFVETFTGNSGLDRFRYGVYHRDVGSFEAGVPGGQWGNGKGGSWTGDHDLSCGNPATQRPFSSTNSNVAVEELLYTCADHLMTSMGDVDSFSIVWFSPDQVFASVDSVDFTVNLTDLGPRQWWKVGVVSDALFNSKHPAGLCVPNGSTCNDSWQNINVPGFILSDVGSASTWSTSLAGSDRMIASWSGQGSAGYPGGLLKIGNTNTSVSSNPAPGDKMTRFPVSLVDNHDGTVTFTVADISVTRAGSFPACPCRVVFYDQNYTPDKDGTPIGHTWHWDAIVIN
jgi:hypothetical protein